jgi:hypothetical protein
MPAINITDLNNAKTDVDHIAEIATSPALTATDRLGTSKRTLAGVDANATARLNAMDAAALTQRTTIQVAADAVIGNIAGITNRGTWAPATLYAGKDIVLNAGTWYVCVVAHTSSAAFTTDSASKWRVYQGVIAADLAAPGGTDLISWLRGVIGAVAAKLSAWLSWQAIHAFEFLTVAEIIAVRAGTGGDMRALLQKALDAAVGKKLIINSAQWKMSPLAVGSPTFGLCLDIPSSITVEFEPGATIELLAHSHTIYQMMRIWDRDNVTIVSPVLNGRKDLNSAVTGEFGMGVDVRGGSNIKIMYPITNNMWGDGCYLERSVTSVPVNVLFESPRADGCRRQGMSVCAADGLTVNNPVWSNIAGTAPQCGLDIEPNSNAAELKGIRINNPMTKNCLGPGIAVIMPLFAGAVPKVVDILIENHVDDGSNTGCNVSFTNTVAGTLSGSIRTVNPIYKNNTFAAFSAYEASSTGPLIEVIRPHAVNPNRSGSTSQTDSSVFISARKVGSVLTFPVGNIKITEPSITLTSGSIPAIFFFKDNVTVNNLDKCAFSDPVELVGIPAASFASSFFGKGSVTDKNAKHVRAAVASETLTPTNCWGVSAPNASVSFDLDATLFVSGSPDIVIRQPFATSCIVRTGGVSPGTGNFVGMTVGQRLQANGKAGAYLRLRPMGGNIFLIVENVGPWAVI